MRDQNKSRFRLQLDRQRTGIQGESMGCATFPTRQLSAELYSEQCKEQSCLSLMPSSFLQENHCGSMQCCPKEGDRCGNRKGCTEGAVTKKGIVCKEALILLAVDTSTSRSRQLIIKFSGLTPSSLNFSISKLEFLGTTTQMITQCTVNFC
jgi:hypothetical protein